MERKFVLIGCMVAMLSPSAWAERGGQSSSRAFIVVRRCVERIESLGERSVRIIAHQAVRSVGLIDHLQQSGMANEAVVIAGRSTAHIGEVVKNADALVDQVLEDCTMILVRMEAPQPALDLVQAAATLAKEKIQSAGARALMAIQAALNT